MTTDSAGEAVLDVAGPSPGIIPALVRLYDRLAAEGDEDLAPAGYSRQQVSFAVVLDKDGTLHEFAPVFVEQQRPAPGAKDSSGQKPAKVVRRPDKVLVLGQAKPSGSGINPCFLWDNAAYMLGYKADDPKPARTAESFEEFRARHLALRDEIDDEGFRRVCKFLEHWRPSMARSHAQLAEYAVNFGVFRLRSELGYVHQRPAIRRWWESGGEARWTGRASAATEPEAGKKAKKKTTKKTRPSREAAAASDPGPGAATPDRTVFSPVTGLPQPIARLHEPRIKNVAGAQSSGATLVSFNQRAFTSFGKDQGENAAIGAEDARKYCEALNLLTGRDAHRVRLAGDTIVFWSEGAPKAETFMGSVLGGQSDPGRDARDEYLRALSGLPVSDLGAGWGSAQTPFYILGLSPNMSRLSVRFWLVSTVGGIVSNIARHHERLRMEPMPEDDARALTIRAIVNETAMPAGKPGFPDEQAVIPGLAAAVAKAILTGAPSPRALLSGVIARCRIEGLADSQTRTDWRRAMHRRCAIIRACLVRNLSHQPQEVPVSLNEDHSSPAYQLGRLFAVLERIQLNALGEKLNSTIKDRYYSAASSAPATVFPRLLRLSNFHLGGIEFGGQRTKREKELGSIIDRLPAFPRTLSLEDQGLFAIGYYHQRQAYFASSDAARSHEPDAVTTHS